MTSRNSNTNIASGIIANGNNSINTTTLIAQNTFYNQVATCTAGDNSISLPIQGFLSQEYNIRNDGASTLNIFPSSSSGQINALGNGVSFQLTTGQSCTFVASTSDPLTSNTLQWYSFNLTASGTGGAFTTLTVSGAATVGTTLGVTGTTTVTDLTATGETVLSNVTMSPIGNVTQLTSNTTAVTINAPQGLVILATGTLTTDTVVSFTMNNTYIKSTSILLCIGGNSASTFKCTIYGSSYSNGSCIINVTNLSAATLTLTGGAFRYIVF